MTVDIDELVVSDDVRSCVVIVTVVSAVSCGNPLIGGLADRRQLADGMFP